MPKLSFSHARRAALLATCVALAVVATLTGANGKRPIKNPKFDPSAEQVDLMDAIEQGQVDALLIPKSSLEGSVFIENKSGKPLTVKLPAAVAGVQVLKQGFGQPGGGVGGVGNNNNNNNNNGGQGQQLGGGFGGGGFGGGGFGGGMGGFGGGGFFSVPADKTVQVPLKSVCLEHGKPEPRPKMTYKLVRLETFTKDPVLQELLKTYAAGQIDPMVAQAAAWHVTDKMSWQQLAAKSMRRLGGIGGEPYFTPAQLAQAQSLLAVAQQKARDREQKAPSNAAIEKKL